MTYDSFTRNIENFGWEVELEGDDILVTDGAHTLVSISSVNQGDYKMMDFTSSNLTFLTTQLAYTPPKER